jgi:multiple sugar transport system substrate-binding protein
MYQAGQFDLASINKENPKIDIGVMQMPHPNGRNTAAILGGWSFVIPKSAKNPTEAKKFIQFLNTSENQGYFTDTFPARISSMKQARFETPILAGFKAMLPYGRPAPSHKNWVQITQAYFNNVQGIMLGNEEPQEAMDNAADDIQSLLDD